MVKNRVHGMLERDRIARVFRLVGEAVDGVTQEHGAFRVDKAYAEQSFGELEETVGND